MKILVFSVAYSPFVGGAEIALREITKRLPDFEFHILTVNLDGKQNTLEQDGNITIHRIGKGRYSKYLFPISANILASKLKRTHHFDTTWSIMANQAGLAGFFYKIINPRIPFILTLQEGDSKDKIKRQMFPFGWLFKLIFKKADKITAISNYLSLWAKEMGAKKNVNVIPNGVDFSKFQISDLKFNSEEFKSKLGFNDADKILITTSRLVKKNGVDISIKALNFLPENYQLLILGDGPLMSGLKSLDKSLKLKRRVNFVGTVKYEEIPKYLAISNIFVRPSRSEGLGNSFIEAMASGIPVIGTSVGGIPDIITHEETGLFCNTEDPLDLAKQITRLMEDINLRNSIVMNAKKSVLEKFDWNIIAGRMNSEIFSN